VVVTSSPSCTATDPPGAVGCVYGGAKADGQAGHIWDVGCVFSDTRRVSAGVNVRYSDDTEAPVFLLRNAQPSDLDAIYELASVFDTVNLPHDRDVIAEILDTSAKAFSGDEPDPFAREYTFVVESEEGDVVGTSQVLAQHGTKDKPHIYFDVFNEERYSATVDRHFRHKVLRIGFNYEGPTEIGGLVLHPSLRGHPSKLGKQLSFVRFLYIALHRDRFRDRVLAELLPPLEPDGRSLLWEALGKRFTGLTYAEADKASKENKEFIQSLFPSGTIYASLLDESARAVIGEVGTSTLGVRRMLTAIGFKPVNRIDPFDGGPHFEGLTDNLSPVRETRHSTAAVGDASAIQNAPGESAEGLVAHEDLDTGGIRAVWSVFRYQDRGKVVELPEATMQKLEVHGGQDVATLAFARHTRI